MPRKPLIITHEYPYHIIARSNNKEWFYIPIPECWDIFSKLLCETSARFNFQIHAFVLMNNHYHLVATASEEYPLPKVMEWLQRSANRIINDKAGRINHLFGGPYKASLISSEEYYFHAIKYVYRNPVTAGITDRVEDYKYSSLTNPSIPLVTPITGIEHLIPKIPQELYKALNENYSDEIKFLVDKAIKKTEFKMSSRILKKLKSQIHPRNQSQ